MPERLFARHLELSSLHGRRRGLVPCIFHRDRTASLSVDLDAGLFHCFGCGEQGGMRRFAELTGEWANPAREQKESMTATIARLASRQPWARESVLLMYEAADFVRRARQAATALRAAVALTGDTEAAWSALAVAAHRELFAAAVEAEYDELLRVKLA